MLRLYTNKICPFAHRAWIAAVLKGAPVELEHVPLGDSMPASYAAINPRQTVPTLVLPNNEKVFESMFIVEYLDAQYGEKYSLNPRDPKLRADIRFFLDVAGNLTSSLYGALMATDEELDGAIAALKAQLNDTEKAFVASKKGSGPFFLGTRVSIVEVAMYPFLVRFEGTIPAFCRGYSLRAEAPQLFGMVDAARTIDAFASTTPQLPLLIGAYGGYAKRPAAAQPLPKLYVAKTCPFAQRARLAAALTGAKVEFVWIDLANPPADFATINPRETVPVIRFANGGAVFESLFVAKYFAEALSAVPALAATEDQSLPAGVHDIEVRDSLQRHNADFFIDDFPTSALFGILGAAPGAERTAAVEAAAAALKTVEAQLAGPFVLGSRVTWADVAVVPFLLRYESLPTLLGVDPLAAAPKLVVLLKAFKALSGSVAEHIDTPAFYAESLKSFVKA